MRSVRKASKRQRVNVHWSSCTWRRSLTIIGSIWRRQCGTFHMSMQGQGHLETTEKAIPQHSRILVPYRFRTVIFFASRSPDLGVWRVGFGTAGSVCFNGISHVFRSAFLSSSRLSWFPYDWMILIFWFRSTNCYTILYICWVSRSVWLFELLVTLLFWKFSSSWEIVRRELFDLFNRLIILDLDLDLLGTV